MPDRGGAPIYYAWPVDQHALDGSGNLIGQARVDWPLPSLLPRKKAEWSGVLATPLDSVRTVLLQIANPLPGGHPVAFANAEMGTVKQGWLTLAASEPR